MNDVDCILHICLNLIYKHKNKKTMGGSFRAFPVNLGGESGFDCEKKSLLWRREEWFEFLILSDLNSDQKYFVFLCSLRQISDASGVPFRQRSVSHAVDSIRIRSQKGSGITKVRNGRGGGAGER